MMVGRGLTIFENQWNEKNILLYATCNCLYRVMWNVRPYTVDSLYPAVGQQQKPQHTYLLFSRTLLAVFISCNFYEIIEIHAKY